MKSSWAGYYQYNTYDDGGVIGTHPYYDNVTIAAGFSNNGVHLAPAVGRAVMELMAFGRYKTINLNRLSFERFITLEPLLETSRIW